jgi:hypothetical protein
MKAQEIVENMAATGGRRGKSDLARALGVKPCAVSLWISRGKIPAKVAVRMAKLEGCPYRLEYLLSHGSGHL